MLQGMSEGDEFEVELKVQVWLDMTAMGWLSSNNDWNFVLEV